MTAYKDRVGFATATTGTGTIACGSALSGLQSFGSSDNGTAFDIVITDGAAWEVAQDCLYTYADNTLTRGTLIASSTGSVLSLSGSATVAHSPIAARAAQWQNATVLPGGRLSPASNTPVITSDVASSTNIYYTPYLHDRISLWNGNDWATIRYTEYTFAIGTGLSTTAPYDLFAYLSGGNLAIEKLAWTNGTTRATDVTLQDGRYCKYGDKSRLLLGTFLAIDSTHIADSVALKHYSISNVYNPALRQFVVDAGDTGGHTYAPGSDTTRIYAGNSANKVNMVSCLGGGQVLANTMGAVSFVGTSSALLGVKMNGTTSMDAGFNAIPQIITVGSLLSALITTTGANTINLLERMNGSGTLSASRGVLQGTILT